MPLFRWEALYWPESRTTGPWFIPWTCGPPCPHPHGRRGVRRPLIRLGSTPPPENPPRTHYSTRRARVFGYLPQQLRDFGKEPKGVVPTVGEQTHRDPLALAAHANLASRPTIVRQRTNPFDELVLRRHLRPP